MEEIISWRRVIEIHISSSALARVALALFLDAEAFGVPRSGGRENFIHFDLKLLEVVVFNWNENPQSLFVGFLFQNINCHGELVSEWVGGKMREIKLRGRLSHQIDMNDDVELSRCSWTLRRVNFNLVLSFIYAPQRSDSSVFMLITVKPCLISRLPRFQLISHSDELCEATIFRRKDDSRPSRLKWFNKISYFTIMIIACVQWNSFCRYSECRL